MEQIIIRTSKRAYRLTIPDSGFLVIQNGGVTLRESIATELGTNTPNGEITAPKGTFGQAIDGSLWYKKTGDDQGWEQFLISENGQWVANFALADATGTVLPANVLARSGRNIVLGDGVSNAEDLSLIGAAERSDRPIKQIKVTTTYGGFNDAYTYFWSTTVRTSTTFLGVMWWDGQVEIISPFSGANRLTDSAVHEAFPKWPDDFSGKAPKTVWMWPCASATDPTVSGEITWFGTGNNAELTSFEGDGLAAMTYLGLKGSPIRSLNLRGLALVETLDLSDLEVTELDLADLVSLTYLALTGLAVSSLDFSQAPGLARIEIDGLLIASVDILPFASILWRCEVKNCLLTTVDISGVTAAQLDFSGNSLVSVTATGFTGTPNHSTSSSYQLNLSNNSLTTDAVYDMLSQMGDSAYSPSIINLEGNPCDGGSSLTDGATRTGVETEALAATKGYTLQI